MPRSRKTDLKRTTLADALNLMTVDQLKGLVALLPTAAKPTRKLELVSLIEQHLDGERLRELWEQLDDLQQKAVSETMYAAEGIFEAQLEPSLMLAIIIEDEAALARVGGGQQ